MRFSVVVPAHNEQTLVPRCLGSIAAAATGSGRAVEVIVVANRCTDETARIARSAGARVVESDARNIAAVRNAGAFTATGDVIVTLDADCRMDPGALAEVERHLADGRCVGGGTKVVPERWSPGIGATYGVVTALLWLTGLGGGMFWCHRDDFRVLGGFDEHLLVAEDLDFARRLRVHGRRTGRRFTTIRATPVTASTRKFDRFGDWHMFAMALQLRAIRAAVHGADTDWVDRYFLDFNDAAPVG
jgi:glycosyltransferase involved in cell wall biosynthesis